MVTQEGKLIPLLAVIGNHDIKGRFDQTPKQAAYFYRLFPSPHSRYWQFKVGDFLKIWLLDSGHAHLIDGKQAAWLSKSLEDEPKALYRFAVYHVPAFPSVRAFENSKSPPVHIPMTQFRYATAFHSA